MQHFPYSLTNNCSVSLSSLIERNREKRNLRVPHIAAAAGFRPPPHKPAEDDDQVAVTIATDNSERVGNLLANSGIDAKALGRSFLSAEVGIKHATRLAADANVLRIQTKKRSKPLMDAVQRDIDPAGLLGTSLPYTGDGVMVGIVDTGFDLSHPMFRDQNGQLRVDWLLDQTANNLELNRSQLANHWSGAVGPGLFHPGDDLDGHGTHVATTAAGSLFGGLQGIAPGARFLLVKTDFFNIDAAVSWIFAKAGSRPCVVNLSLGHHWGAHDGTDLEEQLYETITGPGKLIVVAGGNERNDAIHLSGGFVANHSETVSFDVFQGAGVEPPSAAITLWHSNLDRFNIELITPTGQAIAAPSLGQGLVLSSPSMDVELSRKDYTASHLHQFQIALSFNTPHVPPRWLKGWQLRISCQSAVIGVLDGWFANSGFAAFHPSPLVVPGGTVGLAGTSKGVITVASHVSKAQWTSDDGPQNDFTILNGRSSPFSSLGPARDGAEKPEVSAPGQYLTAALGSNSSYRHQTDRADTANRLVSVEGTSMAAPVFAGVAALMLEKNPSLTPAMVRNVIKQHALKDLHTGLSGWTPAYGYGKVSVESFLNAV